MLGKLLDNKKKLLYVLILLAAVIALLAAGMVAASALSHNEGKSGAKSAAPQTGNAAAIQGVDVDASAEHAAELFACKVEDVENSAAVASLLGVMELESVAGKYSVQIAAQDDGQVLTLATDLLVKKQDEAAFNANMEKYVQQMLALIPQLDKVEWIYSVESSGEGEEQAVGMLDDAGAEEALGRETNWYGESERNLQKLLEQQVETP